MYMWHGGFCFLALPTTTLAFFFKREFFLLVFMTNWWAAGDHCYWNIKRIMSHLSLKCFCSLTVVLTAHLQSASDSLNICL